MTERRVSDEALASFTELVSDEEGETQRADFIFDLRDERTENEKLRAQLEERETEASGIRQECSELLAILAPEESGKISTLAMVKVFGAYAADFEKALEQGILAFMPGTESAGTVCEMLSQMFEALLVLKHDRAQLAAVTKERDELAREVLRLRGTLRFIASMESSTATSSATAALKHKPAPSEEPR